LFVSCGKVVPHGSALSAGRVWRPTTAGKDDKGAIEKVAPFLFVLLDLYKNLAIIRQLE
jgi:hypothetical protein